MKNSGIDQIGQEQSQEGLVPSNGSAPTVGEKPVKPTKVKPKKVDMGDFAGSLQAIASVVTQEVDALEGQVNAGKKEWVRYRANRIVGSMRSASHEVLKEVADMSEEVEAEAEFFYQQAGKITNSVFAVS